MTTFGPPMGAIVGFFVFVIKVFCYFDRKSRVLKSMPTHSRGIRNHEYVILCYGHSLVLLIMWSLLIWKTGNKAIVIIELTEKRISNMYAIYQYCKYILKKIVATTATKLSQNATLAIMCLPFLVIGTNICMNECMCEYKKFSRSATVWIVQTLHIQHDLHSSFHNKWKTIWNLEKNIEINTSSTSQNNSKIIIFGEFSRMNYMVMK